MGAEAWPDDELSRGQVLAGRYRLTEFLGRGGMGLVFAALDLATGSAVAVKLPRREVRRRKKALARFRQESRAAARLSGPHVVRVSDVAELDDGTPFIVMELLVGIDLASELDARGALPLAEAVDLVLEAAAGVAEAHAAGIVHRDLKPHNLFLANVAEPGAHRSVKVLDFGISKLGGADVPRVTTTGARLGTPLYVSPEQLVSAKYVDARTDVWSLGVILYELVTGTLPFEGPTAIAVAAAIQTVEPPPPSSRRPGLPPELDAVVMRALAKRPDERFGSVAEFVRALAPFAASPASATRVTAFAERPARAARPEAPRAGETLADSPRAEAARSGARVATPESSSATLSGSSRLLLVLAALLGVLLLALAVASR
ncbi:MAG TPA: serine/threonine-protein kinase [Polyangiaceae bacterium]